MPNTSSIQSNRAFFMARTVRTPGATEEPTTVTQDPVATEVEQENKPVVDEQLSDSGATEESFAPDWVVQVLKSQARIEEKLDALAEQAGVKVKNKKRLKFVEGQGYVREQ